MINVLITSFGSNTSIGIAKCIKDNCFVLGTDSNPFYQCNGYSFADKLEFLPYYNHNNYEKDLLLLVEKYDINCIIPIHDKEIEIISKMISKGILQNIKVAVNSYEIIKLCNDKYKINSVLKDIVKVPCVYQNINDIKEYPVIIKENDGVSSNNINIANNKKEIEAIDLDNKLIQQFVEGDEVTVDCYTSYVNPEGFYYSVRKRIETKAGMSVKSEIIDYPEIGEYCKKIHKKLNYKGVSNIQFIIKDNKAYFIEINPRFAGAGILTYKSGYNFPLMTIEELYNNKIKYPEQLQIGNKMVRYYEETFFDESNHRIRPR